MNNQQRIAVISGASQGIGAAALKAYRAAGYRVVANSRSIGASDDPGVLAVAGDIADPGVARRVISLAVEKSGRVDTLINNAGVFSFVGGSKLPRPMADAGRARGGVLVARATGIGDALADARMGRFEIYRLVDPEAEAAQSAGRGAAGTGRVQQNSPKSLRKKRKRTPALQSKRFAPTSTVSA